jgi:hypothetical protein
MNTNVSIPYGDHPHGDERDYKFNMNMMIAININMTRIKNMNMNTDMNLGMSMNVNMHMNVNTSINMKASAKENLKNKSLNEARDPTFQQAATHRVYGNAQAYEATNTITAYCYSHTGNI